MLVFNLQLFGGRGNSGTARDNSGSSKPTAVNKITRNVTDAKSQTELNSKLKERGLVLDAAYQKASNGEEVVMYKMNANGTVDKRYVGTYNEYRDGGREIVNIKEKQLISEVSFGGKTYNVDKNGNWKEKGAKKSESTVKVTNAGMSGQVKSATGKLTSKQIDSIESSFSSNGSVITQMGSSSYRIDLSGKDSSNKRLATKLTKAGFKKVNDRLWTK